MHLIQTAVVEKYLKAPSAATVTIARRLHERIRDLLGGGYETFLQGSYRNDTGVTDLDDVDIVAVRKQTISGLLARDYSRPLVPWDQIFAELEAPIAADPAFRGRTSWGDKCIKVKWDHLSADVVPALVVSSAEQDPITVWSRRATTERPNMPRLHYDNGVAKQRATGDRYKETVRMLKAWARGNFGAANPVAPSFYLECLVFNAPNALFVPDTAERFAALLGWIQGLTYNGSVVKTCAGDKDILTSGEWPHGDFAVFHDRVAGDMKLIHGSLAAATADQATTLWRIAFNDQ